MSAKKTLSVKELLLAMSDADRAALLAEIKASGASVKPAKAEKVKVYVAKRIQKTDTLPNAKHPRKAGEVSMMTEASLLATLQTWVRGKDAEVKIALITQSIKSGHAEDFKSFRIEGIVQA